MVIVLIIVVFVVMASEIARAFMPWMFVTVVIWEIFAIEAIYTKQLICAEKTYFSLLATPVLQAHETKKGHA
ncbi:hypothetical protein M3I54_16255 [Paraburkholderia sp. CNPSo 3274]|uniref:hypothetical protein n=1 Tax=Paraburkholderia sp. CNPSo 3274 TaxID=2940932 RepID=UPI0020B73B75|nr:hypothetical protein [Paraburkholderia sp. CNPSo 3274]MCP3708525.1 hypothetical protein [Paraburkholderia sp. CNPSo 3274]